LKGGVYPASFGEELTAKAPNFYKWAQQVAKHPSVNSIFEEEAIIHYAKKRIAGSRNA
jgi:glutathione S-transferase